MSRTNDKRPQPTAVMRRSFVQGFDYQQLPTDRRRLVQDATDRIRGIQAKMATNIVDLGKELEAIRAELGPRLFAIWAAAEFHYSVGMCSKFMRVAERFGDLGACLPKFQSAALLELACTRVPDEVVSEAVERAEAGEEITRIKALELVERHEAALDKDPTPRPRRDEIYRIRSALRTAIRRWPAADRAQLAGQVLAVVRELLAELGLQTDAGNAPRAAASARGKPVRFKIDPAATPAVSRV